MALSIPEIGEGVVLLWNNPAEGELNSFDAIPTSWNDQPSFNFTRDALKEELAKAEAGESYLNGEMVGGNELKLLVKWLIWMVSAIPNRESQSMFSMLFFIESAGGFLRGDGPKSFKNHVDVDDARDNLTGKWKKQVSDEPAFKDILIRVAEDQFLEAKENLPSWGQFLHLLPTSMTTRSAGGPSVNVDFESSVGKFNITFTDKVINFMATPNRYIGPDALKGIMTQDNPGKIFRRDVPARATRAVFAMHLSQYTHEVYLGTLLLGVQASKNYYSLARQSGSVVADMKWMIFATSRKEYLVILNDYSSFDATEHKWNVRKWLIEATKVLDDKEAGPFESVGALMRELWERMDQIYFDTGDGVIRTDMVNSGEYFTILINNMVNYANFLGTLQLISTSPILKGKMKGYPMLVNFMGDDSIQIWNTGDQLNTAEIAEYTDIMEGYSGLNGLIINKFKVSVRSSYAEYLKKAASWGMIIGRMFQIQVNASERVNLISSFQEIVRSESSQLTEWVSRGGNHEVSLRYSWFLFNLKRRVKREYTFGGKDAAFQTIPMAVLYSPGGIGGAGLSTYTLPGPNKDIPLVLAYNNIEREACNFACSLLIERGGLESELANDILRTGVVDEGKRFIRDNLDTERLRASSDSIRRLAKFGIDIGRFTYANTPQRLVHETVKSSPKIGAIAARGKTVIADEAFAREAEYNALNSDKPILHILVEEGRGWQVCMQWVLHDGVICMCESQLALNPLITEDWITWSTRMKWVVDRSGKQLLLVHEKPNPLVTMSFVGLKGEELEPAISEWLLRNATGSPSVPNLIWRKYSWLRFLQPSWGSTLPMTQPLGAIATHDWNTERIETQIGISSAGDSIQARISKEILRIVSSDPKFPRDIRPDVIVEFLRNPAVISDGTRVIDVLVAMGAKSSDAAKLATSLEEVLENQMFANAVSGYSVTDSLYGNMDTSIRNIARFVEKTDFTLTTRMNKVLTGIGTASVLMYPYKLARKRVKYSINYKELLDVEDELSTGVADSFNEFITMYPQKFID
jgi:hypothetical protein